MDPDPHGSAWLRINFPSGSGSRWEHFSNKNRKYARKLVKKTANKTLHKDIFYNFFNKLDPDPDPHSEKLLVPNPHSEKLLDPDADRHKMNVNPRD